MKLVSKPILSIILVVMMIPMTMVVAFADDGGASSFIDFSSIFNEDLFSPLVEGITSNIGVLLPVGLGLFAVFFGPRLIVYILWYVFGIGVYYDGGGKFTWFDRYE